MDLTGKIVGGMGEGSLYVEKYNKYFAEKLGFEAFPGTLNLKTQGIDVERVFRKSIKIVPLEKGLFPVLCRDVIINSKVKGAVVRPLKTSHPQEVLELIAPLNIKEYFNVKEGDVVKIRVL